MQVRLFLIAVLSALMLNSTLAHDPAAEASSVKRWRLRNQTHIRASFLAIKNDTVLLESSSGKVRFIPFSSFSDNDQMYIRSREAEISQLNQPLTRPVLNKNSETPAPWVLLTFWAATGAILLPFITRKRGKWMLSPVLGSLLLLLSFKNGAAERLLGTDPLFIDSAFAPFKPHIATRWDNNWFYVESNGLPTTHNMMVGITKWQQQVPTPQCYIGNNAWQIPLNPVLADVPVPVNQQHFLRGAVAIAANGIPIFNPYTNTGVDAFLDGQLDQWGGHSGRADDYHYHTAPLHLDAQTPDILPIAFALDGFAIYGSLEPDGATMLPLDANHGHFDAAGVYHYHGTPGAPYMIGNMVGKVTEDATLQIIPQAAAQPVRPALTPLSGATITGFQANPAGNGYDLTYTRNGQTYHVEYSWTTGGVYTYHFVSPTATTTSTYNGHLPCVIATAVNELPAGDYLTVFPNPGVGRISLKTSLTNIRQLTLFNMAGQPVFSTSDPLDAIPTDHFPKGIYLLKISTDKLEITRKLILQ